MNQGWIGGGGERVRSLVAGKICTWMDLTRGRDDDVCTRDLHRYYFYVSVTGDLFTTYVDREK